MSGSLPTAGYVDLFQVNLCVLGWGAGALTGRLCVVVTAGRMLEALV